MVGFALMANMLISAQQLQQPLAAAGFGLTAVAAGLAMVPSGLAMVAFSPVSGAMINKFGGRVTLLAGAMIMAVGYVGRVFYDGSVSAVVVGSTVVSVGSAVAYAAMPSLIMVNGPITETASANGLNAPLRALGTSSASATIADLLSTVTARVGPVELPTAEAFRDVFWIAALACLLACGVVWFVPKRARAEVISGDSAGAIARPVIHAGENAEIVIRGRVVQLDNAPIPQALVTAVSLTGDPLDWSRADNTGAFSLALPGPGRYLLIANADGWTLRSAVVDFAETSSIESIRLTERLMLTGQVRRGDEPLAGAVITLSAHTGEFRSGTTTDADGRYRLRLPPPGHIILTVLEPGTWQSRSRRSSPPPSRR